MDPPLLTLVNVCILGAVFGFFASIVDSQKQGPGWQPLTPSRTPPPPSPKSSSAVSSVPHPYDKFPPPPSWLVPPPPSWSVPPPPPSWSVPPPPSWSVPPPHPPAPPSSSRHHSSPHKRPFISSPPPSKSGNEVKSSPPPAGKKINTGKKVGWMFLGIAIILQVCVVAFLVIKRRQLFN